MNNEKSRIYTINRWVDNLFIAAFVVLFWPIVIPVYLLYRTMRFLRRIFPLWKLRG